MTSNDEDIIEKVVQLKLPFYSIDIINPSSDTNGKNTVNGGINYNKNQDIFLYCKNMIEFKLFIIQLILTLIRDQKILIRHFKIMEIYQIQI